MRQGGKDNHPREMLLVSKDDLSYSIGFLDTLLRQMGNQDLDTRSRQSFLFLGRLEVFRELDLIDSEDVDRYIKALCRVWLQFQGGWSDVVA